MKYIKTETREKTSILLYVAVTTLTLTAIFAYICLPECRDSLIYVASIIVGISFIYSAYYVGASVRLGIQYDRMKNSFEFLEKFNNIKLIECRTKIKDFIDSKPEASNELSEKIKQDFDLKISIRTTLNLCENVSIAIQKGYVDEAILCKDLFVAIPWFLRNLGNHIQDLRNEYEDESIYCEMEKLADSWTKGKYLSNDKNIIN